MTWVRFDDNAPNHPKLVRAGAEAAWLWHCSISYSNAHKLDGRIDKDLVSALYAPLAGKAAKLAPVLVRVGLWHDHGDHYEIHDYAQYQEQALKESVEARREYERERKRAQRAGDKPGDKVTDCPGHVPDNHRDTVGAVPSATRASPVPSRPDPSEERESGDSSWSPLRSQMRLAWDACGILSPNDDRRIGEIEPKLVRLAAERGAEPLALWASAIRRIRSDAPTKAKRMANLSVMCAQLEQWVDDAPIEKRADPVPACRRPL